MVVLARKLKLPSVKCGEFDELRAIDRRWRSQKLGILAFEAARTMSRLVALRQSLSPCEVGRLRCSTLRSTGVAYLNSTDQLHLRRLACAELLEDLDRAAASVSRLTGDRKFLCFYSELKRGDGDLGVGFHGGGEERCFAKMERQVGVVSKLRSAMEDLAQMEASRRRCNGLKEEELSSQRQLVRKMKAKSLWSESAGKTGDLIAGAVVTIFTRLCVVFAPVALDLPLVVPRRSGGYSFSSSRRTGYNFSSPLPGRCSPPVVDQAPTSSSGPIPANSRQWMVSAEDAPANTLGGSGLARRYAKVVALAAAMAEEVGGVGEARRRVELYEMLPCGVRRKLRARLGGSRRIAGGDADEGSAWRDAAGRLLEWLGPMAADTERWYEARSCENAAAAAAEERRVFALQTLVFSDHDKAEAAVVELLVALTCAARCRRGHSSD